MQARLFWAGKGVKVWIMSNKNATTAHLAIKVALNEGGAGENAVNILLQRQHAGQ